jgi:hypothetical protein
MQHHDHGMDHIDKKYELQRSKKGGMYLLKPKSVKTRAIEKVKEYSKKARHGLKKLNEWGGTE